MIRLVEGDAFEFLADRIGPVVTSIPTAVEVDMAAGEWWSLFVPRAVSAIVRTSAMHGHPAVFLQTDRLADGRTYSWPQAIFAAVGAFTWHKVALRRAPGKVDIHRPTYRHLIAIGGRPGARRPDVIEDGERLWRHGAGWGSAVMAASWLAEMQPTVPVLNPFCGVGTFLGALDDYGVDAIGCDIDDGVLTTARDRLGERVAR